MSNRLPNVNLGFNDTQEISHDLQLDQATIDSILSQVEDKPLVLTTPLADITILNSKRDALRDIIQKNPIRPTLKIIYQSKGDCQNLGGISIEELSWHMTGTTGADLKVFGFGVELKVRPEITGEVIKETPCQKKGEVQMVRNFWIDWYLDISISPGGSNTQFLKRNEQLVTTPCCAEAPPPPAHAQPQEDKPKKGSGWFD